MIRWFAATAALVATVASATAGYTVSNIVSLAPADATAFGTYTNNALAALSAGGAQSNGAVGPGQYNTLFTPPLAKQANVATGFTLWNGTVNPGGVFAGQIGNRVAFGLVAQGTNGSTFTPNDVTFTNTASPHLTTAFPNGSFSLGSIVPSGALLGRDTNGALVAVTSASQTLSALYYVGPAFGFSANFPGDFDGTQAGYDALNAGPDSTGSLVGTYSLLGSSATSSADFNAAPAPATVVLMGLGMAGAGLVTRLRRRFAA